MIYFPPNHCPKTREEAFKLQEQTVYLHYHIELVKQAIDVLQESYFNKDAEFIKEDLQDTALVLCTYRSAQLQVEIIETLIEDCLEYIALLRGEENIYTNSTDRTIAVRNKIRELYAQNKTD